MAILNDDPVSIDDHHAIADLLARYNWAFDENVWEDYASLWTGEGLLTGFGDPIRGMEALKAVHADSYRQSQGKWRHHLTNLVTRYGATRDEATAKGYNLVTRWDDNPGLHVMVLETFDLVRTDAGWRVKAADLKFV